VFIKLKKKLFEVNINISKCTVKKEISGTIGKFNPLIANSMWELIVSDIMRPFKKSKNNNTIFVDYFTRFMVAAAIPYISAEIVKDFIAIKFEISNEIFYVTF
jgi:hypothetical protein